VAGSPIRRQQEATLREKMEDLLALLRNGASDKQAMQELGFPSSHPMYTLAKKDEEVRLALARAREEGAHAMSSEVLDIADELVLVPKVDPIRVAQLQMEARKWLAGKRNAMFADSKANIGVQVNVNALHLQALKATALPVLGNEGAAALGVEASPIVDVDYAEVGESGGLSLADLL
jgi:hypothetical protein